MMSRSNNQLAESEKIGDYVTMYKRGLMWHVNYTINGKQHRQSLKTKSHKLARTKAIRIEADIAQGLHQNPIKDATIEDVTQQYISHLVVKEKADKTLVKVRQVVERMSKLAAERKVKLLRDVNLSFVDAYQAKFKRKPKTVLNHTVIIRQIVNFAKSRKLIVEDPLQGLQLRKVKSQEQPCWTWDQVQTILSAAGGWQQDALTLLAETGMRVGEARWLTWEDVDFERKVLRIRSKEGWTTKTGNHRPIPISPCLAELLSRLERGGRWVLRGPSRSGAARDRQFSDRTLLTYLKRLLKRLGLPGHLHTFRHSFISHALISGVPEPTVRSWVGHVDADILRTYTHINDQASQAAMARLSGAVVMAENSTNTAGRCP